VLVNHLLPDQGALKLTRALRQARPEVKVIVVGLGQTPAIVLKYVEAGASGYVLGDDSVDALRAQVRAAAAGRTFVSPEIAGALISRLSELAAVVPGRRAQSRLNPGLTPREWEVLALIGQDKSNAEIAAHLVISVGTVKNHVHNLFGKLDVNCRQKAARYYQNLPLEGR
jgi:DNA-binding NarL/FixJ family response regulator